MRMAEDGGRKVARWTRAWWRGAGLALLLLLAAPAEARAREPRAALDVRVGAEAAGGDAAAARLSEMLAARLQQEGFQVVPVDGEPDVVVSLSLDGADCLLRATLPTGSATRTVPACGAVLADDQLELVQKASELVRRAYRGAEAAPPPRDEAAVSTATVTATTPAATPTPTPTPTATPTSAAVVAMVGPATDHRAAFEVSTGVGLRIRAGRVDPIARLGAQLGPGDGWSLHAGSAVSETSDDLVTITEGDLMIGVGRRLHDGRFRLEAAAAAGALVHHFSAVEGSGTRLDPLGEVAVAGSTRLARHVGLEVRIAPGLSRTEYTHLAGNTVAWSGSRLRVDAGVALILY